MTKDVKCHQTKYLIKIDLESSKQTRNRNNNINQKINFTKIIYYERNLEFFLRNFEFLTSLSS